MNRSIFSGRSFSFRPHENERRFFEEQNKRYGADNFTDFMHRFLEESITGSATPDPTAVHGSKATNDHSDAGNAGNDDDTSMQEILEVFSIRDPDVFMERYVRLIAKEEAKRKDTKPQEHVPREDDPNACCRRMVEQTKLYADMFDNCARIKRAVNSR